MKKINLYLIGFIFIILCFGCKDDCRGFRDEPMLTFSTSIIQPVEIYFIENNQTKYLGTIDTGSNVFFGINSNVEEMKFQFKYLTGLEDTLTLTYKARISYQNKCEYQVFLDKFSSNFTKNNIYKNHSYQKTPKKDYPSEKDEPNGYTFQFY